MSEPETPPTYVHEDGTKVWKLNGLLHRDGDKPAVVWADGTKEWWFDGFHHRDGDKPAVVSKTYAKWCQRNALHRDNGKPALMTVFGEQEWWVRNRFIKRRFVTNFREDSLRLAFVTTLCANLEMI